MNRILVPTDFSAISVNGYKAALKIARKLQAEIYLVNVIEPIMDLGFSASGSAEFEDSIKEEDRYILELHKVNERRLFDIASRYVTEEDVVYPMIAIDKVGDGIVNFTEKYNIDLIVMGTSGESTFEEYFVGNNTEQVMRETHCPVLAIRDQVENFEIENIVIATDLKSNADIGMNHLGKLLGYLNPQIHLIHISKTSSISIDEINKQLKSFASKYSLKNFSINIIRNNNMKHGIQSFAKEVNADIIVAFTHGRKGLANIFKGNISEDLVKHAQVPILSIHYD